MNFIASVSKKAEQALEDKVKAKIQKEQQQDEMIAKMLNPNLRGWMNYFGNSIQRDGVRWTVCKGV